MRWFLALLLFVVSTKAMAGDVQVRTSVLPTVGTGAIVHRRVALTGAVTGRFVAGGPNPGDSRGIAVRAGPRFRVHPLVNLGLDYGFAYGQFPLEGPGQMEHLVQPGVFLRSQGEKFVVSNAFRVDLRTYRPKDDGWKFHLRPRDEIRMTGVIKPWLKISQTNELLLQPSYGWTDMLQLRVGLAVHGEISLTRKGVKRRRKPSLFWIIAHQFGLSPVSMFRADKLSEADAASASMTRLQRDDRAETLDTVVTIGLSGLF